MQYVLFSGAPSPIFQSACVIRFTTLYIRKANHAMGSEFCYVRPYVSQSQHKKHDIN